MTPPRLTDTATSAPAEPGTDRIRIDKWLWHARVVKSRTLAQKLVSGGDVRVDGNRQTNPAQKVSPGQVLTISVANAIKVLKIAAIGTRRGPAPEAATLYEDLSPPIAKRQKPLTAPAALREKGAGRPTKKERRDIERFNQTD